MIDTLDQIRDFYVLDKTTVSVVLIFCGWAAYTIRDKLTNPASLIILYPIFVFIGLSIYALAANFNWFSPKRMVEWLTYTVLSASIGAIVGILLVAVLRSVQDRFVTLAHIRQTLKRDKEQEERGYPAVDI
jgi:hypothetical protein